MGYGSVPVGVPWQEPSPQELGCHREGPGRAGPTANWGPRARGDERFCKTVSTPWEACGHAGAGQGHQAIQPEFPAPVFSAWACVAPTTHGGMEGRRDRRTGWRGGADKEGQH